MPAPFQPQYADLEQRLRRIERELTRGGGDAQAAVATAVAARPSPGGADIQGSQIPEAQVVFDDTSGHDHSTSGTPVPLAGDVTGTNTTASVDKIHGKTAPSAPVSTDAGKALRYDGSTAYLLQGQRLRVRTVTTTATFGADDDAIKGDATGGAFSVNLPAVAASSSVVFALKRINAGGNNVTLQANGAETIDGANTYVLTVQYASVTVVSDGVEWSVVGKG